MYKMKLVFFFLALFILFLLTIYLFLLLATNDLDYYGPRYLSVFSKILILCWDMLVLNIMTPQHKARMMSRFVNKLIY